MCDVDKTVYFNILQYLTKNRKDPQKIDLVITIYELFSILKTRVRYCDNLCYKIHDVFFTIEQVENTDELKVLTELIAELKKSPWL